MIADGEERHGGGFGLAFLDIVSGGFGAAFFLFLLFVTLPITVAPSGGGGSRYLDFRLEWSADQQARLELIVEYTAPHRTPRYLRLSGQGDERTVLSGRASVAGSEFWEDLIVAGYSGFGDQAMLDSANSGQMGTLMRFIEPCAGTYRLFVNPVGQFAGGFSLGNRGQEITTTYNIQAIVADDSGRRRMQTGQTELRFGLGPGRLDTRSLGPETGVTFSANAGAQDPVDEINFHSSASPDHCE